MTEFRTEQRKPPRWPSVVEETQKWIVFKYLACAANLCFQRAAKLCFQKHVFCSLKHKLSVLDIL